MQLSNNTDYEKRMEIINDENLGDQLFGHPDVIKLSKDTNFILDISYDSLTDVLYIILNKLKATRTVIDDNFLMIRMNDSELCGITIDGFKNRLMDGSWKNEFITKYKINITKIATFIKKVKNG